MGNCQAVDAAAMVIQHPSGKIERHYSSIPVSEVMKTNPGHYVSLIIPLQISDNNESSQPEPEKKSVRYTRVKLLRTTDTLHLGHAYRLLTSQEVMKVVRAKKLEKMQKIEQESAESSRTNKNDQGVKNERQRGRPKSWRPSLQSITEAGS